MILRFGVVAGTLLLVGGCTWAGGDGRDRNPMNRPGYIVSADRSRDHRDRAPDHRERGGGDVTSFAMVNGADVVQIRLADLGDDRYDVSTPDDSRIAPAVTVSNGEIIAGVQDSGEAGPAVVNVVLDDSVRWQIRLAGGAVEEVVDLSGGPGGNVDFSAGTSRATVRLPAASGTQRVLLAGGAGQLNVRLAGTAPVRVRAGGGAGTVTIDGGTHSGIPGGTVFQQDAWPSAADRFDIDATSGVSSVDVTRAE